MTTKPTQHHQHHTHWDDRAVQWIEKNWNLFLMVFVAGVALGGAYVGYGYFQESKEKQSQEELFLITSTVQRKTEKLQEELEKTTADQTKDKKDDKNAKKDAAPKETPKLVKNPDELKKHFAEELSRYQSVIETGAGSKARVMAALQLAGLARDYKDLELAKQSLEKVVNQVKPADIYFGLVNGLLASTLSDLGQCKDAISALDKILAEKSQSTFYSQSLLRKGACHLELNEWDKAEEAFSQVEKDYANSSAAYTAKNMRRLVSFKKGS